MHAQLARHHTKIIHTLSSVAKFKVHSTGSTASIEARTANVAVLATHLEAQVVVIFVIFVTIAV